MMKYCSRCKTEKPIDQFGINRKRHDGRQVYCLACWPEVARESRERKKAGIQPIRDADRTTKFCAHCQRELPVSAFHHRKQNGGYASKCRECHKAWHQKWLERNPDYHKNRYGAEYRREIRLKRDYNLTPEQYEAMVEAQQGRCAICQQPPSDGDKLFIDHNHKTGQVHGLLCKTCNASIGQLGDSPYMLMSAIQYLVDTDGATDVTIHPLEQRLPAQTMGMIETLSKLYAIHLSKNADYSPANILATGEIGLVTRLWDKVARLMNLTGFRITISESRFDAPRDPKHESIDDTLMDAACYAIIGLLLRRGQWGR